MEREELIELVETGEGYTLEFKEGLSSSLGKDMCAFANASGGKILIGVRDDCSINGFTLTNSAASRIQDIARNMNPHFAVNLEQVDDVLVIYVPEGKDKPYTIAGHFYLRQSANSQQLNRDEIRELFQRENYIEFERKTNLNFDFKNDFNNHQYLRFLQRARIPKRISKKHILKNLNLLAGNKMNNAGVLFFCNKITKFYAADIVCVLWKGTDKVNIVDMKEFNHDFISNYEGALKYIASKLNTNEIIQPMGRDQALELPENALREAIINAMIHRDYFSNGRIQIDIFIDRLEISNPGKLLFDKKELGKVSLARNPIIVDMAYRLNLVEKLGSGIKRIKSLVLEKGLKVAFDISPCWFRVVFLRATDQKPAKNQPKTSQKLAKNKRIELILDEIKAGTFTKRGFADKIGMNKSTVETDLQELINQGKVRHVGPKKGGHWIIIED